MLTRFVEEQLDEVEQFGLTVVEIARGKHWKVRVVAPNGRAMLIIVSATPSNRRAACKFRAQLQRFARTTLKGAHGG